MSKRSTVRGRGLAVAALAAFTTTGVLVAPVSPVAAAPEGDVTIASSPAKQHVRYGSPFKLAGRVAPGQAGHTVRLEHAERGATFRPVASARTGANGVYRFAVTARRTGSYRAVSDTGAASAPRRVTVFAAINGSSTRHVLSGRTAKVRGKLLPGAGHRAAIQVRTRKGWKTVDHARSSARGRFSGSWRPRKPGTYRLRVRFGGDRSTGAATSRSWRLYSYRASRASWYGPGLYGNKLGCGGRLSAGTLGVANKHLPCGTKVKFRYHGRSVTVPVVDRGPYVGGREWDLTAATKARLGFPSIGTVWSNK